MASGPTALAQDELDHAPAANSGVPAGSAGTRPRSIWSPRDALLTGRLTGRITFLGPFRQMDPAARCRMPRLWPGSRPSERQPGLVQQDEIIPLQLQAGDDVGLKHVELIVLKQRIQKRSSNRSMSWAALSRLESSKRPLNYNLADLSRATGRRNSVPVLLAVDRKDQAARSEPLSFSIGAPETKRSRHSLRSA